MSPASAIYGMEARSKQFCNRWNAVGLEQNVFFCISNRIDRMINKVPRQLVETMILVTYTWLTQLYNTLLIRTSIQRPLLLLVLPNLLLNSLGKKTSPCENQVPEVSGVENHRETLKITGKPWKYKEFQAMQSNLGLEAKFNRKLRIGLEQVG